MLLSTVIMAAITLALAVAVYLMRGQQALLLGSRKGLAQMLQVLPIIVFAFAATGLFAALVPEHVIRDWLGNQSGWKGIMLGSLAGGIAPGGPLIQSAIAGGLFRSGAGIGTIVAFLTAGVLWGVALVPLEASMLGWRLLAIRIASTFFFPPIAGWIAHVLFGRA